METIETCKLCDRRAFSSVLRQRDLLLNHRYPFFQVVRCDSCGLLFTNPRPSREELIAYYPREYYGLFHELSAPAKQERITTAPSWRQRVKAQILAQYDTHPSASGGKLSSLVRLLLRPFLYPLYLYFSFRLSWQVFFRLLSVRKGRILDVGCGTGFALAACRKQGWTPFGVEPNPFAARYAREVLDLSVHEGELLEAHFPAEFFDLVLFHHTLEHMPSPLRELHEAHRILKKSGALVVTVPNAASLEARLFGPWWFAWELPRHLYHFTPKTISALMAKAEFRVHKLISRKSLFALTASMIYLSKYKYGLSPVSRRFLTLACRPALILFALLFALAKRSGEMTIVSVKA